MDVLTTVRLPAEVHEALRRRAFEARQPIAELVREAVRAMLKRPVEGVAAPPLQRDPFWRAVGSVPGGETDEAVEHDHYLYNRPRKRTRSPRRRAR